jgi:UDP-N-acetylglucosamine 1-carboxyvinyltransferase
LEKILIKGEACTSGDVRIGGAKNSALPIIAASLLTQEKVVLHNVPQIRDVATMTQLLQNIGAKTNFQNNDVYIEATLLDPKHLINNDLIKKIRYSSHLIGALLPQFKKIKIPIPGGCQIGRRNLNSHFIGLKKLGAKIKVKDGNIEVTANMLKGSSIQLEFPSVGATEHIMIAACLAKGTSTIENVAKEPEIEDLAKFLNALGADITGAGTSTIQINGVKNLKKTEYTIMPDRIETGTYIAAAAITGGEILLKNTNTQIVAQVLSTFEKIGVSVKETKKGIKIAAKANLNQADVVTEVYPGFPTDMQPLITSVLAVANGKSTICENIFERRFTHVPELTKMGAKITVHNDTLKIEGVKALRGANVYAHDIRAGASIVLAALKAEGETTIENAHQIFRGYENPIGKLQALGVQCTLIN